MKKKIIISIVSGIIVLLCLFCREAYAANSRIISNETESTIVKLKEKELSSLEDYEESYGSKAYGTTAYILHKVQIFSIPFCFLGILIGAIFDYVIGIRHIETKEKGLALMVTFITLAIICQVLPLVFTIVVKFGRE